MSPSMSTIVSTFAPRIGSQSSISPETNSVPSELTAVSSTSDLLVGRDPARQLVEGRRALRRQPVDLLVQVRDLQLGLQVDLVFHVAAHALLGGLTRLAEQHEDRKDDRLQRHHHRQQAERE